MERIGEHKEALVGRVRVVSGVVGVLIAALAGAFWFVQIVKGSHYRDLAENNRLRRMAVKAPRGTIVDRNGRVLVENLPSYNLLLDRSRAANVAESLRFASPILGRPLPALEELLQRYRSLPKFQPVLLGEGLSLEQVARVEVEELSHPEFLVEVSHRRLYRLGFHAAHVLGYLGEARPDEVADPKEHLVVGDWVGRRGIERSYDGRLRGEDGEQVVVVDSRGQPVEELGREMGRPGELVRLTLDAELQQESERQLEGKVGAIVALDPRNGEIRALVSSPSFDPNLFARRLAVDDWKALIDDPFRPLQNRALQSAYPPGSTFKVIVAAAGLAEGVIDTRDSVYCAGVKTYYKRPTHCWKAGGHGHMTLESALKNSCDIFFYDLGQKLGIERIARYARMFDLGQATGIDLDGERSGLVPDPEWSLRARRRAWYPGETISASIGQGALLTTPIQLATVFAAFANGGRLVTPHLVEGADAPSHPLPLPATVLDPIRRGLWKVVNDKGTGQAAYVAGAEIAGKTGTTQVVTHTAFEDSSLRPWEERNHAWFASYAPFSNPTIVIVVFIEHGGQGSRAAAPVAKALYEKFFGPALGPAAAS
ncbi:MAG: penicillin-binding protein 2 [Thermoanaerobaculia bacterium]